MADFQDKFKLKSKRILTDEGYMQVPARIGRTGVQEFRAGEIGLTDRDPMDIVRVFRPAEEVFNDESMRSFENKAVTNDHPPKGVKVTNHSKYAKGSSIGDVKQEKEIYLATVLQITDQRLIDTIKAGKVEVSNGYSADLDIEDGVDEVSGERYDVVQRNIKGNHIAIVTRGRAGPNVKLSDKDKGNNFVKVSINDVSYEIPDGPAAEAVQKSIKDSKKLESNIVDLNKTIKDKEKEIKDLKDNTPDINARVATRVSFIADVAVVDAEYKVGDKSMDDVKREILADKREDLTIDKDAKEGYIDGLWDALVKDSKSTKKSTKLDDTLGNLFSSKQTEIKDENGKIVDTRPADVKAREAMVERNKNAYKNKAS